MKSGETQFWKSQTVNNAQAGIEAVEKKGNTPVPKSINDFNKELEEKKKTETTDKPVEEKKAFVTASGKNKCINKGCNKEFDPADNTETSCNFHPGAPVTPLDQIFHDIKKKWTCCPKETYDWDEFMKLPTCSVGKHNPKLI